MKKLYKAFAAVLSVGVASLLALTLYIQATLPDNFYVAQGESFYINSKLSISTGSAGNLGTGLYDGDSAWYRLNLNLFGSVPIKQVQVQTTQRRMLVPGGFPFGIKMFTEGVMVVGMSDIQLGTENVNPAKNAGLKIGDIILAIDDQPIEKNDDIAQLIAESEGNEVKIDIKRKDVAMELYLQPVQSEFDNAYRAGIWVRDSSAGIGTMTFYDPETLIFAGLGHAVCDVDTGDIMPLSSGEIVDVNISGVNMGLSGKPGELKGTFNGAGHMGVLLQNTEQGVFGKLEEEFFASESIPMALKQEIQPGPASILVTVSGNKPQSFDIEIEKVNYTSTNPTKNMVLRIKDPQLLAITGGIVQGMSGSPIVQNGTLVGAITHVFVNDPSRGYGIFAENMYESIYNVENNKNMLGIY